MREFILEYMEHRGAYAENADEQKVLDVGIKKYLYENGIGEKEKRIYYRNYVQRHLKIIEDSELKRYFMMYPVISEVHQICIEFRESGKVSEERKKDLRKNMGRLYRQGLGDRYVPAIEIKALIGGYLCD